MNIAEEERIEIVRRLIDAYVQGNAASINALILDDCVFADEGSFRGKAEELKYVARPIETVKVAMSFEPSVTRVHDNCATVTGYLTETLFAGEPADQESRSGCPFSSWRNGDRSVLAVKGSLRHKERAFDRPGLL